MNAHAFLWPHCSRIPPLGPGEIHVWAFDLERPPTQEAWNVLSEEESARARHFVFPRDRDRYVRAHSAMRVLLGAYSGTAPAEMLFSTSTYGKPELRLDPDFPRLRFNLSHSAGLGVLAVAREYEVGVDVEIVRPLDSEIAKHNFSNQELATLASLTEEQWLQGFFRCWTSKEALLKGEGLGLNLPLDAFDVEAHPGRPAGLLDVRPLASLASGWRLTELKPARDAVCTLASRKSRSEIVSADMQAPEVQCFAFSG